MHTQLAINQYTLACLYQFTLLSRWQRSRAMHPAFGSAGYYAWHDVITLRIPAMPYIRASSDTCCSSQHSSRTAHLFTTALSLRCDCQDMWTESLTPSSQPTPANRYHNNGEHQPSAQHQCSTGISAHHSKAVELARDITTIVSAASCA